MTWGRALPWVLLLLGPFLLFPAAWLEGGVVSADDHLSVQPAFQEEAGGEVRHPHLSDPAMQFASLRRRVIESLSQGEAPLWNPDIYGGAPLLADGQSMVGSPVTWLRLVLDEDMAQNLGVSWILGWTGLGLALLLRRLGVQAWPAAIGGAAAMTGPFVQVWLLHPQAATICWIPWLLWAIEGRALVGVSLCTLGLLWGGHPGTAVHGLALGTAWWAIRTRCRWTAAGLGVGVMLSLPLTLPLLEQGLRSTTAMARGGSVLEPAQLLDLVWPGWHGHPAQETWSGPGSWADGQLHPGMGTLLLALPALGGPRERLGRALWLAWLGLILISLIGLPGPFNHARLGSLGTLLLAICAGLGAERLQALGRPAMAGFFAIVLFSGAWARDADQGVLTADEHNPEPAAWTQELVEELDCVEGGDCGRVLGLGWWLQPNTGSLVGLRDLRGYDLPVSEDTHRLMTALSSPPRGPWYPVEEAPSMNLLRFAAVRVLLAEEEPETEEPLEAIPLSAAPVGAWRLPGLRPRAWLSPSAQPVEGPGLALAAISQSDLRSAPPVEGLDEALQGEGEIVPVDLAEPGASRRRVLLQTDRPSFLVIAESWAPGWTALLDGEPVKVFRVGGAFMGVSIPSGEHELTMAYRPKGWIIGCWGGASGWAILMGLIWLRRRSSRPADRS